MVYRNILAATAIVFSILSLPAMAELRADDIQLLRVWVPKSEKKESPNIYFITKNNSSTDDAVVLDASLCCADKTHLIDRRGISIRSRLLEKGKTTILEARAVNLQHDLLEHKKPKAKLTVVGTKGPTASSPIILSKKAGVMTKAQEQQLRQGLK